MKEHRDERKRMGVVVVAFVWRHKSPSESPQSRRLSWSEL